MPILSKTLFYIIGNFDFSYFKMQIKKSLKSSHPGWFTCYFLLALLLSTYFLSAQSSQFQGINSNHGLTHNTVYDIIQDKNGFLWFATREGLNKYDGYRLRTYYSDDLKSGLLDNQINCLAITDQNMYVGTEMGLNKYIPEMDKFTASFNGDSIQGPVRALHVHKNGVILAGTIKELYTVDKKNVARKILDNINVRSICSGGDNNYWLALARRLLKINIHGEIIKEFPILEFFPDKPDIRIHKVFKDSNHNILLGTSYGLYQYDAEKDKFSLLPIVSEQNSELESKVVRTIAEDEKNRIWIGTENGIFIYDKENKTFEPYPESFNSNASKITDKSIYSIYPGRDDSVWIGTYFGGVLYKGISRGFEIFTPRGGYNSISGKAISEIIKANGKLWIATEDGGISIYDRHKNRFSYINTNNGLTSNNVHALQQDHRGNIWIGTFLGGLNRYDPSNGKIISYRHESENPNSLSSNYVFSLLQDTKGKLWIGTQRGLNIYDFKTNTFHLFKPKVLGNKFIYDIIQDSDSNYWFCTRYSGIYKYDVSKDLLENFTERNGLSSNQIISGSKVLNGDIWFGTLNGGLIRWEKESNSFKSYRKKNGLKNNNVYKVLQNRDHSLWFSSNMGITKMEPSGKILRHYSNHDGLSTNQFNFRSGYQDSDGYMYFGSVNGLNVFHPDSLQRDFPKPKIHFTSFTLFNQPVSVGENDVLKKHIDYADSIKLEYDQNALSFEFAAINYPYKKDYRYLLRGFDKTWNNIGEKNSASYTNLPPGEYDFLVRSGSKDNFNERSIHLSILPPFWKTNWAYLGYGLITILLIYLTWWLIRYIHRQKLAVEFEKLEKQKIKEINKHKLDFFTFISHEFKTPLTIIIASIESFMRKWHGPSSTTTELTSVKKSTVRLQYLINQLMEFRQTEAAHAKLKLKKGDIIHFLKDTFDAFSPLMNTKNLDYKFKTQLSSYNCYFDPTKIEMIITNLLSNAIKNTPEQGRINLSVSIETALDEEKRSILRMVLKDTGCGISSRNIPRLFDPYFTKEGDSSTAKLQSGSGIGMALVKSLLDFMDGRIYIESKVNKGSTIDLRIPLRLKLDEVENDHGTIIGNKDINIDPLLVLDDYKELKNEETIKKELTLMIVEDNPQIIKLLYTHFSSRYKILKAKNGRSALKQIENYIPDIIISDLMMPEMSGINLCKEIRRKPETSHIPFLLITGKEEKSYKLEGLRVGANAIIQKPFSLNELELMVKNLLETHQKRIKRFADSNLKINKEVPTDNNNYEFMKKVNQIIDDNYNKPDFNVENLAHLMGISRSHLHLKMKENTGTSASIYLRGIRINRAAELIKKGMSVAEAAYKTGYNDPNYFSRVFKKEFKVSPSSYQKN